eukprot:gene17487-biopygen11534
MTGSLHFASHAPGRGDVLAAQARQAAAAAAEDYDEADRLKAQRDALLRQTDAAASSPHRGGAAVAYAANADCVVGRRCSREAALADTAELAELAGLAGLADLAARARLPALAGRAGPPARDPPSPPPHPTPP